MAYTIPAMDTRKSGSVAGEVWACADSGWRQESNGTTAVSIRFVRQRMRELARKLSVFSRIGNALQVSNSRTSDQALQNRRRTRAATTLSRGNSAYAFRGSSL